MQDALNNVSTGIYNPYKLLIKYARKLLWNYINTHSLLSIAALIYVRRIIYLRIQEQQRTTVA